MKGKKNIKGNSQQKQSWLLNKNIQAVIVCFFVLFLYSGVTKNEFIGLDDTSLIVDNYPFIKDWKNVPQAFKQDVFKIHKDLDNNKDYYRPMVTLSFMLDAHLDATPTKEKPLKPKLYLVSNIVYHAIACILLLFLFHALNVNALASLLLTLLFSVHPLLNQAVAWIPGRNDSILSIFVLASMLFFLKYVKSKTNKDLALHLLFFALAMFSKENAIVLTAICVFYLLLIVKEKIKNKSVISLLLGYLTVLSIWFLMRKNALSDSTSDMGIFSMISNIFSNGPLFFQYIGKSILPYGLSVMSSVEDTNYVVGVLAMILIGVGVFLSKNKNAMMVLMGLLWFFLFLTPSMSASLFGGLEHRAYVPYIGFLIVFSEFDWIKNITFKSKLPLALLLLIIVGFMSITFNRLSIFKNRFNFYLSAIETSPHSVLACLNLGKHYEEIKEYNKAIDAYRRGLERDPKYVMLHNNIAGAYMYMKMYPEAEVELKKELENYPNNSNSIYNLGLIYRSWGRDDEAVALWKKTIEVEPNFIFAYQQLVNYYQRKGDMHFVQLYSQELKKRGY